MTPAHAMFTEDESGRYLPANAVAIRLADELGRLRLTANDLLAIRARGVRTIKQNGEPIHVAITV